MHFTFELLKTKYFPELNVKVIGEDRIIEVFNKIGVLYYEVQMKGKGAYVREIEDKTEYVFINRSLKTLLKHATLAYESVHALSHVPAAFLESKQNLEAEVLSLIMMIPRTDLERLNRIKHHLDDESYDYLMRRNKVAEMWKL